MPAGGAGREAGDLPRDEAPEVRVRAALRLAKARGPSRPSSAAVGAGVRSAARRRGVLAARGASPGPTSLRFGPMRFGARAPRHLPAGPAGRPCLPRFSTSAQHLPRSAHRLLDRRVARKGGCEGVLVGYDEGEAHRGRADGREVAHVGAARRETLHLLAVLARLEGRARCTGHLGGRLRRQRSNLRNLFAWDLVDPVAYRPIPLASLDIIAAPRRNSCPKTPFLQRRRFRQTLRRLGRLPAPDPGGCYYGSMWRLRAPSSAEAPPT